MLALILLSLQVTASVLIPTPTAKTFEYKAHMYSKDYQSYVEWYLENRTKLEEELLLIELFNEAQKHFLSGDSEQALTLYLKVINMEHDKDWKKPQRDLIVDSYLQVLKLNSHNQEVYKAVIEAAHEFGRFFPGQIKSYIFLKNKLFLIKNKLQKNKFKK